MRARDIAIRAGCANAVGARALLDGARSSRRVVIVRAFAGGANVRVMRGALDGGVLVGARAAARAACRARARVLVAGGVVR